MNKSNQIIIAIIIVIILIVVFYNPAPEERGIIKIGILEPLTGIRAEAGNYYQKGLDLALPEINNDSSKKYQLELIYEDTQYDPKIGLTAFNKLKEFDNVNYIIGAHGSSVTLTVAKSAEESKIILITAGSQSSAISEAGDYIFRTQINTAQEAPFLAKLITEIAGNKSIHVLGLNTDYTVAYMENLIPALEENGGKLGLVEKFDPKEADYRTHLLKAKGADAEYILLLAVPNQAGQILKQAKELNINATFIGSSPVEGEDLLKIGGEAAEDLIYIYPYDDASDITSMKTYRNKYLEEYNEKPEMLSANIYDTLHILSFCFEKTGDNVESVKDCLYGIKNYKGASGILSFDENGDIVKPFITKTVKNNQFVLYEEE